MRRLAFVLSLSSCLACSTSDPTTDGPADGGVTTDGAVSGFDDHTQLQLTSVPDYFAFAASGIGRDALKYVITHFEDGDQRAVRFMDGNFYTLHDEWYWFRLLNGEPVAGVAETPVDGLEFMTIDEVYVWARARTAWPLDLVLDPAGRFYSAAFYDHALVDPRALGLGTVVHVDERDARPELWYFELEFSDELSHEQLVNHFEVLKANLPEDIATSLKWLVRSATQEELAKRMEDEQLDFHDCILRANDITVPGEVEVYSPGLTAGVVVSVGVEEPRFNTTFDTDLLVTDQVPDWLPPAAALITSVPQTPLAHVNVLARNRGIPNAYKAGAREDPAIDQIARVAGPAIVRAEQPDILEIVPITGEELATWRQLQMPTIASVPWVDTATLPYTLELTGLSPANVEVLRPQIGGKAAGFLDLLAYPEVTTPDRPLAITIRAYVEHFEELFFEVSQALTDGELRASPQVRFLFLEGETRYDGRYTTALDVEIKQGVLARPAPDPVADIVRRGGLVDVIRNKPIDPSTLQAILTSLRDTYGHYAVTQGLRFRSSSTVEDIEGFNGAGLYDSNTGFLEPAMQPELRDQSRTVERAISRTWSSYWRAEAFEERRSQAIDHLTGNMAVLVHARHDDPKELSNGVFTFTILPPGFETSALLEMNVQMGAVSVTNPDTMELPEVDRVVMLDDGSIEIDRVRPSTLSPDTNLFDDAQLRSIFDQALLVTRGWLDRDNRGLDPVRHGRTLTLDFEVRHMDIGWPLLASDPQFESRIVIKQARSLEPGLRQVPPQFRNLNFPKDVLGRARRLDRWTCASSVVEANVVETFTDASSPPNLGHDVDPFVGTVLFTFPEGISELGLVRGATRSIDHTMIAESVHSNIEEGEWILDVQLTAEAAAQVGFTGFVLDDAGEFSISRGDDTAQSKGLACTQELLFSTPREYLLEVLRNRR